MQIAIDHRAGPLKVSDLKQDYPPPNRPVDTMRLAEPDISYLDRHDRYQVLYFVNMFANLYGKGSSGVARQAEKLLHQYVPPELHSHESIKQWMLDHWKFHN